MRPKVESYDGDVQLVILRTARYDDAAEEVEFGEISVFLSPTVRDHRAAGRGQRAAQRPHPARAAAATCSDIGTTAVLWAILDSVVDDYAPVVAGLERDIDQIEATVFSGAVAPTERIYSLRREATDFYRAVHPLLGVVGTLERDADPYLRPYLRDVHDHLMLVNEEVAAQRDLLGTILEANMAVISVEQTKVERPAERHDGTADRARHRLPAADVRHRLLRPELRLARRQHRRAGGLPVVRDRRPDPAAGRCCTSGCAAAGRTDRYVPFACGWATGTGTTRSCSNSRARVEPTPPAHVDQSASTASNALRAAISTGSHTGENGGA